MRIWMIIPAIFVTAFILWVGWMVLLACALGAGARYAAGAAETQSNAP